MRIISGYLGGRRFTVSKGSDVRPTTDRVRESLFSSLGYVVEGARVLDLFAGSGALGFECISRGAEEVVFVEKSRPNFMALKKNAAQLNIKNAQFVCADALGWLKSGAGPFDIIFLDPPYYAGLMEEAIERIVVNGLLAEDGQIIAEKPKGLDGPLDGQRPLAGNLQLIKEKKYGKTLLVTLKYAQESREKDVQ